MADREERKIQASKHEALMKGAFAAETQAAVAATIVYEEGEGRELSIREPAFESTETVVTKAFVPEAAYRYATGKTLIVDPAAFTRPGGAYEDGAFGPEQVICSESNLYQILCGLKETYHDKNRDYRRGMLCTDRAAYIPEVVFQHGGTMRKADVLAISEPLRVRALENHRSERECDTALAARIETILRIAVANECETLVCGAFACGNLGYASSQVIELFNAWIDAHPGSLARVVFAVPRVHFDAFDAAFGKPEEEEAPAVVQGGDIEDEDAFDISGIDLPEGVTFRS